MTDSESLGTRLTNLTTAQNVFAFSIGSNIALRFFKLDLLLS